MKPQPYPEFKLYYYVLLCKHTGSSYMCPLWSAASVDIHRYLTNSPCHILHLLLCQPRRVIHTAEAIAHRFS